MKWGTVSDTEGLLHVVPVDDEGYVLPPHYLARDCRCHPQVDGENERVIVHNLIH